MSDATVIYPDKFKERSPLRVVQPLPETSGLARLFNVKLSPNGVDVDLDRDLAAKLEYAARQIRLLGDECLLCRRPKQRKALVEFAEQMEDMATQIALENSVHD